MKRRGAILWLLGAVALYVGNVWTVRHVEAGGSLLPYTLANVALVAHYAWLLRILIKTPPPRAVLHLLSAGAFLMAAAHVPVRATEGDDALTYVVHGYMHVEQGVSPYIGAPSDARTTRIGPELDALLYRYPHVHPSPYGPLWSSVEAAVWRTTGTVRGALYAFQALGLLGWVVCSVVLARVTSYPLALAFALNPVILLESAMEAHFEVWAYALVGLAWLLRRRGDGPGWAVALAFAACLKPTFALFFPAFAVYGSKRGILTAAAVGLATAIACIAPAWVGPRTFDGLLLHAHGRPFGPLFLVAAVVASVVLAWRQAGRDTMGRATVLPQALCMSAYWYPWYYTPLIGEMLVLANAAAYVTVLTAFGRVFPLLKLGNPFGIHHAVPHQVACLVLLGLYLSHPSRWRRPTGSSRPRG